MADTRDGKRALLEKSIEEARSVLTEHSDYLRGNETATRILVIDKMLVALGWDVTDPAKVRLEHRANRDKVDYALLSTSEEILGIVEAKSADTGLDSKRKQASGYATEVGTRYAILTNGGRWEAWEMGTLRPREKTVFVEVNLSTGEVAEIAENLAQLHWDMLGQ